jgi:WXG100 family type VII secretion target
MSMFSVETPTVSTAAAQVQDAHVRIDGLLKSLNGRLAAVLDNPQAWRGDSQVAFAFVHQKIDTAVRNINEALSDIGLMLARSATTYTGSDADNRTVIDSVTH